MKSQTLLFLTLLLTASTALGDTVPTGWFRAGNRPGDYDMAVDTVVFHGGKKSAYLKCIVSDPQGFGTMMQNVRADSYRGKRVRLSGYVRTQNVTGWAGFWMRVDGDDGMLAFDNMDTSKRPIKGTTEWKKYEVVLDVPEASDGIAFGLLLSGDGQVWMDDLKLEIVTHDVASTDTMKRNLPATPVLKVP